MLMLSLIRPGCVCMDTTCQAGPVPHMANDMGPHPHPYGLVETTAYEWRRKPWWKRRHAA